MKSMKSKLGTVIDDEFIKFDDGTYIDFQDPTMGMRPAFKLPPNGTRVDVTLTIL